MELQVTAVLVLLAATVATSGGFVLDDECPAPAPCTCRHYYMHCRSIHLTSLPVFRNTSTRMTATWTLELGTNGISSVPDNAFLNLATISNGHDIRISLPINNLTDSSFGANAFNGISDYVIFLDVSQNKLTSMPAVFKSLPRLAWLHIGSNPLGTIDPQVMIPMRHTLHTLFISLPGANTWPTAFHYLNVLQLLDVLEYKHNIPHNAFAGFLTTLTTFALSNIAFTDFPVAVCRLERLARLDISSVEINHTGEMGIACPSPMTSMTELNIQSVKLKHFPNLFTVFPNMLRLSIMYSDISYIDDSVIPSNTTLERLTLSESKLASYPDAINKFTSLKSCDLHHNSIVTLERRTVENLPQLAALNLNDNPIVFISKLAFRNVPALATLDLGGTRLTAIPQAIETLPVLITLSLERTPISCSCDNHWVKNWLLHNPITINGNCEVSNEPIKQFINVTLPICP